MTRRAAPPPPPWVVALVALALWWVLRATLPAHTPDLPPLQFAIFGWLIPLAAAIVEGLRAVKDITLFIAFQLARLAISSLDLIRNAAIDIGIGLLKGMRVSWRFLRELYTELLKPGWKRFWDWVDRAREWLEKFFKPILEFLGRVREEILKIYDRWVRPILDTIEMVRKVLSVAKALGFEWAKKLDAELARIEDKINEPFVFALQKINEVINVIDRIVTADGLFQRLALIKSIERDIKYVHAQLFNAKSRPLTAAERASLGQKNQPKPADEILSELTRGLQANEWVFWTPEELADVDRQLFGASTRG